MPAPIVLLSQNQSETKVGEVSGTQFVIRQQPDGTALDYDKTYYVKIIAKDADGRALPSEEASGQAVQVNSPDIAADSILANHIVAGQITAEKLAAVMVLASTIATAESGQRVVIDETGISLFDSDGAQMVSIPTEGNPFFRATIEALGLDVLGALTLRGQNNVIDQGATITLRDKTADPAAAPSISFSWEQFETEIGAPLAGLFYDSTNSSVWTSAFSESEGRWFLYELDPADYSIIRSDQRSVQTTEVLGAVRVGSHVYVLVRRPNAFGQMQTILQQHSESTLALLREANVTPLHSSSALPGLAVVDGEAAVFARIGAGIYAYPYDSALVGQTPVEITDTPGVPPGTHIFGAVLVNEGGTDRWFIDTDAAARVQVYAESNGDIVLNSQFSSRHGGIAHDGTKFLTIDGSEIRHHTEYLPSSVDIRLWVQYAYENSSDQTTLPSPMANVAAVRRALPRVTIPELPADMDHAVVYADESISAPSAANMIEQLETVDRVSDLPIPLETTGDSAPTSATLPGAIPATFESEDGSALMRANGYSRIRLSNIGTDSIGAGADEVIDISPMTVTIDTDDYDSGLANDRIILPFTGQYMVLAVFNFAANASGRREVAIQRAPSPYSAWTELARYAVVPTSGAGCPVSISETFDATAGDAFRFVAFQNSGGSLNINGARIYIEFRGPS